MTVASTLAATAPSHAGAAPTHEAQKEPLYVWLFLAGLAFTMFSGHTGLMGLPLSPDRPLFAFSALLLILDPNRDRLRWRWFYAIAALTIVWTAFSWFATGSFTDALKAFALLDRIIVPLAMFPLGALIFATDHRRELLLRTTALMAIYLGFVGFFEYIRFGALVFPSYIMENLNPSTDIRAGGPYLFPEPVGLVCALAIFLSGLLVRTTKVRLWRIVGMLGIFFGFVGTVVCMVRSVWLALIVSGLVVGLIVPRIRRRLPLMLIAAAIAVAIIVFVFPDFRDVLINRITTERSVYDRQNTNVAALRVIEQFPIFGIGWGEFVHQNVLWVRQADTYPVTTVTIEIHNVFLSRAAETGIPGLLLWLLCFVTGPLLGLLSKPLTASARYWKLAALAAFFIWFMPSLSSPNPYPTPNFLVWLIWGIAARGILVELPTRPADSPLRATLPA